MKKIGIIEENSYVREFYSGHFNMTRAFEVVFSVSSSVYAHPLAHMAPQIILLNVSSNADQAVNDIKQLKKTFPTTSIVAIASDTDKQLTARIIASGAAGFLLKSSSATYIAESLQQIDKGGMPLSPGILPHLIQPRKEIKVPDTDMTKREMELIELLSGGFSNKVAANLLNVTYFTVNQHLKNIYKKLHINSKPELISWFLSKRNQQLVYTQA